MFEKRYRLLREFAKGLRKTQSKTFLALARALIGCGQVRSFALAGQLAKFSGIRFKSALQRFYRWVHNDKVDDLACWSALAARLVQAGGRRLLVAVDWTEWKNNLRVLNAALCVDSRAIPVLVQAFSKTDIPRSQNTRENTFLHLLVRLCERMGEAVLIFDRGFRRVSFIRELSWLKQPFIVRLAVKVHVEGGAYQGLLSHHPLRPGQLVDLGPCALRQAKPVNVRVIGVWAPGQKKPWWLATSLAGKAKSVAEQYDRRMAVEEQFRDSKGCRFGLKIEWTAFRDPRSLARLFLLAALAMTVWVLAALLACRADPTLRLKSKSKGARRSLLAIGIDSAEQITQVLKLPWTTLLNLWPRTRIRNFAW
jgi:hypothetical protein